MKKALTIAEIESYLTADEQHELASLREQAHSITDEYLRLYKQHNNLVGVDEHARLLAADNEQPLNDEVGLPLKQQRKRLLARHDKLVTLARSRVPDTYLL